MWKTCVLKELAFDLIWQLTKIMTGKEYIKSDKIQYYFCDLAYRPNC